MLRKCHGHGLTKGAIIQIFYHGLDEPTQGILDVTAGGHPFNKSPTSFPESSTKKVPNQFFSILEGTLAMDSQIISLKEELQDMRKKYNELREENASKNHLNDDTPMCERHEANYIQSEDYQNQDSHNSFSHQSHHDPNDSEKSLSELNNDVKNDLEDFKRRIRSMRTVHWKLFARDDGKTTGVLPNKESKTKEFVEIESFKSLAQHSVNDFVVINIPEEDVGPKQIILDPDDQPMWESAKTVAPTPNSVIVQPNVDDNFVINSTHLNMIRENKFNGYPRADPHDRIREFLAICDMFKYGETQSEAVKLLIFPYSLSDKAKTWFNELNEESITSWEQMRKAFINRFFPPSLFNRLLLEIRSFSQLVCENLTDAWLRLKNMLQKCHGHGLTKGAIIQVFYYGLDEPTQSILDVTVGGIFLYKSPNQSFQLLEDKVLFNHDWPIKSKNEHHQISVAFANGSNSNNDKFRFREKLASLTIKMDSQIISLNEELEDIRNKYNELREGNASKNHLNYDTLMCERHEANYIQYEDYQNQNSHDSSSRQSLHDPNDSEKSLTELNNDVKNDLEDFKRRIRSMRTFHWKLYDSNNRKTTGVLPNKKSKPINQEPQSKTDFEKLMTKFLDDQRVTSMFFKNNVNDMILKMKQNEKNFQTIIKNMERKIDEWSKSQNVFSKQTDRTNPLPPPQTQTEHVNAVFTETGKADDSSKILKDQPPSIIVNNKTEKDKPIKTSKKGYHVVETKEYPFPLAFSVEIPKVSQSKKNVLDEEEVLCQP
ncbi:reverse transcriptase domain-containing protein [Tanacetum coccineum]